MQINSSDSRVVTLTDLRKYTRYTIQVRGYTRIGDGELSSPARVIRTFEDGMYFLGLFGFVCVLKNMTSFLC